MTDQRPPLDKQTQLIADLFDLAMKLRYENTQMRATLTRIGMPPKFPEYGTHDKLLGRRAA